jgi:hypothetical protein
MHTEAVLPELAEIEGLHGRIEAWRQMRPKSRPMPEELWREASAAAKRLGAGRVARALGVKYETLKQRVISGDPSGGGSGRNQAPGKTEFVELREFTVPGLSAGRDETVVEMVAADGMDLLTREVHGSSGGLGITCPIPDRRGPPHGIETLNYPLDGVDQRSAGQAQRSKPPKCRHNCCG